MDPAETIRYAGLEEAPPDVRAAANEPGRRFGRYVLVDKLGEGGFSEVWRAWETGIGRFVAVKFLTAGAPDDRQRFLREAQMAGRLTHPNIVAIHEMGSLDGRDFIVMALVEGRPLSELRLPVREALRVIRDAARAVHHAHALGIIHRDLKPANLMLDPRAGRVTVLDFGLARQVEGGTKLTLSGIVAGTPGYMAPEQARGVTELDAATDVYGLGATLYDLLTGHAPFVGENAIEILKRIIEDDPAPPRKLNARIGVDEETIALKALEKEPVRRYPTAAALADDIDRHLRGDAIEARRASIAHRVWKRLCKQPVIWSLAALLAASIAAGAVFGAVRLSRQWEAERHRDRETRRARVVEQAMVSILEAEEDLRDPFVPLARIRTRLVAALVLLSGGLDEFPDDRRMPFWRGRALDLLWRDAEARAAYTRTIDVEPDNGRARLRRIRVNLRSYLRSMYTGRPPPDVMKELDQDLIKIHRLGLTAQESELARCYDLLVRSKFERTLLPELDRRCANRTAAGGPTEEFHFLQGLSAQMDYRWRDSIAPLRAALDRHPRMLEARFNLAAAHFELEEYEDAERELTRTIELNPDFYEAYSNRGIVRGKRGDPAGERADYDAAIRIEPKYAAAYLNRAGARGRAGDLPGQLADCTKAIELDPDYGKAYGVRASIHVKLGDMKAAYDDCTKAVALEPGYFEAYALLSLIEEHRGRREEAIKALQRVLDLAPPDWPFREQTEARLRQLKAADY